MNWMARVILHRTTFGDDQFHPEIHSRSVDQRRLLGLRNINTRQPQTIAFRSNFLADSNRPEEEILDGRIAAMSRSTKFCYGFANALLFFALIASSSGLECYECNSHNDSRCADDVPPSSMKKACHDLVDGSKYTFCRKIDQQVEFKVNGLPEDRRIVRSCGWDESRYKNECYDRSGFGGSQRVCSCYGDNCNGGGKQSPTFFYILVSHVAAALFTSEKTSF